MSGLRRLVTGFNLAWIAGSITLVMSLFLSACALGGNAPQGTSTPGASTSEASPAPISTSGLSYTNPVYNHDFADPFVMPYDQAYYAFATNDAPAMSAHIPSLKSLDLAHWEYLGDALPKLPEWAVNDDVWAPSALPRKDQFILYYAVPEKKIGLHCISYATSDTPQGPYEDHSTAPFLCQTTCTLGYNDSIDPYPFVDNDGQAYLVWTTGDDPCNNVPALWVQRLNPDGISLTGERVPLLTEDQYWEQGGLENPAMVRHGDKYYLLYSANRWDRPDYAVGYALCDTPMGPCRKPQEEPILKFDWKGKVAGPGGEAVFQDFKGNLWLAYHAWTYPKVGYPNGARSLRIDRLVFEGDKPVVRGPTEDPQPLP